LEAIEGILKSKFGATDSEYSTEAVFEKGMRTVARTFSQVGFSQGDFTVVCSELDEDDTEVDYEAVGRFMKSLQHIAVHTSSGSNPETNGVISPSDIATKDIDMKGLLQQNTNLKPGQGCTRRENPRCARRSR